MINSKDSYRAWFLMNRTQILHCVLAIESLVIARGIVPMDAITYVALSGDLQEENLSAAWLQYVAEKEGVI